MTAHEAPSWLGPDPEALPSGTTVPTNGAEPSWMAEPSPALRWRSWDARLGAPGPWHARHDRADGSKAVTWRADDGRPGLGGHKLADLVYLAGGELPPEGAAVVVTEGERAADAAAETGAYALGTVCGASATPGPAVVALLTRYRVTLSPDNDPGGRKHMGRIARRLQDAGVGACRWIDPPDGAAKGWDLADVDTDERRGLIEGARSLLGFGRPEPEPPPEPEPEPESWPPPEDRGTAVLPAPGNPMGVARRLVGECFTADDAVLIRAWRGSFSVWDGRCWPERDETTVRAEAYRFLEHAVYEIKTKLGMELRPWEPTRIKIANVLEALRAVVHLPETVQQPSWLEGNGLDDPRDLLVMANGILHVPTRRLSPHDPRLFTSHAVPFDYQAAAPTPDRWLSFLHELWPDDDEAIALLQEMFGYVLSGDTRQQKIMALVGPTRAGKGVIANLLSHLLGRHNVGAPTLAGLTTNFGLQDLIGKTLAVVSDARLGPKANVQALAERLLSVSGEDAITIDRKYKAPWTGRLGVRFLLLTNELPRFTDASGALAKRFVLLVLQRSFYGRENPALLAELLPELPGVLNWSLDGLDRLRVRGRFSEPASAREAIRELEDLASPMSAFLHDRCLVGHDQGVSVDALWAVWKGWCEDQSQHHGTKQTFGRDLRSTVPGLRVSQPRDDGEARHREYVGVGIRTSGTPGTHGTRTFPLFSQQERAAALPTLTREDSGSTVAPVEYGGDGIRPQQNNGQDRVPGVPDVQPGVAPVEHEGDADEPLAPARTCPTCHHEHPAGTTCGACPVCAATP